MQIYDEGGNPDQDIIIDVLAAAMYEQTKDKGVCEAKDVTVGFDRWSRIRVGYATLADAVRLDAEVRALLGRKAEYTYEAEWNVSYGSRGPSGYVTATTTLTPN